MSNLSNLYKELTEESEKLGKNHWVETGNFPPQINAVVVLLFKKIKELEEKLNEIT